MQCCVYPHCHLWSSGPSPTPCVCTTGPYLALCLLQRGGLADICTLAISAPPARQQTPQCSTSEAEARVPQHISLLHWARSLPHPGMRRGAHITGTPGSGYVFPSAVAILGPWLPCWFRVSLLTFSEPCSVLESAELETATSHTKVSRTPRSELLPEMLCGSQRARPASVRFLLGTPDEFWHSYN